MPDPELKYSSWASSHRRRAVIPADTQAELLALTRRSQLIGLKLVLTRITMLVGTEAPREVSESAALHADFTSHPEMDREFKGHT